VDIHTVTVEVCYAPSGGIGVRGHLPCEIVDGHRYADDPEPGWYAGPSQYARSSDPELSGSHAVGQGTSGNIYDSGVQERPSGAFRLPEQRPAAGGYTEPVTSPYTEPVTSPYADPVTSPYTDPVANPYADPVTSSGSYSRIPEPESRAAYDSVRIPVRGPEYPTVRPSGTETAGPAAAPAATPTTYGGGASSAPESLIPISEPTSVVPPIAGERPRFDQPRPAENVYQTRRPVSSFVVAVVMVVLMIPVVRLLVEATFTGTPTARAIVPAVLLTLGFALSGIGLFAVAGGRPLGRDAWLRPPVAYLPAGLLLLLAAGLAVA
jgi:hypothetical protein